ncbi:hypothetical protein NDU88_000153 [Pleurodeles waltl]|uniref:Uncharacterized protein n=1 Tax=Pleurodeles waltl TaxID=8319 RepID=A0AAV7SW76_PLEWA|nr:hypothetical protein NDU88_000153 [Pleurodeles waltl]
MARGPLFAHLAVGTRVRGGISLRVQPSKLYCEVNKDALCPRKDKFVIYRNISGLFMDGFPASSRTTGASFQCPCGRETSGACFPDRLIFVILVDQFPTSLHLLLGAKMRGDVWSELRIRSPHSPVSRLPRSLDRGLDAGIRNASRAETVY